MSHSVCSQQVAQAGRWGVPSQPQCVQSVKKRLKQRCALGRRACARQHSNQRTVHRSATQAEPAPAAQPAACLLTYYVAAPWQRLLLMVLLLHSCCGSTGGLQRRDHLLICCLCFCLLLCRESIPAQHRTGRHGAGSTDSTSRTLRLSCCCCCKQSCQAITPCACLPSRLPMLQRLLTSPLPPAATAAAYPWWDWLHRTQCATAQHSAAQQSRVIRPSPTGCCPRKQAGLTHSTSPTEDALLLQRCAKQATASVASTVSHSARLLLPTPAAAAAAAAHTPPLQMMSPLLRLASVLAALSARTLSMSTRSPEKAAWGAQGSRAASMRAPMLQACGWTTQLDAAMRPSYCWLRRI